MEAVDLEYVGFWPRVGASIIDGVIQIIVVTPLLVLVYGRNYFFMDGALQGPADFVISYVLPAVAVIACWRAFGATPGKMALGARIVDAATGAAPSTGQYVGRYLGYFLSIIPLGLGLFWVGFDRKKRGWHDIVSGTVVVRPRYKGPEAVRFE